MEQHCSIFVKLVSSRDGIYDAGMSEAAVATTGARARTRRAILDAAIATFTENPAASLADIAVAADVGRTTVHRYFPERSDLLVAIGDDALEKITVATARARLAEGDARTALDRLCQEYFEFGDVFMLLFTMPETFTGPQWEEETDEDRALLALLARGQAEGTFDPEVEPEWAQQLIWAVLYTGWEYVRTAKVSRHHALSRCLRTLRKATAP